MKRTGTTLTVITLLATAMLTFSAACAKKPPKSTEESRPPVTSKSPETNVPPPTTSAPRRDVEAEVLSMDIAALNKKG